MFSGKKIRVTTVVFYMDDILNEENVLMTFKELEVKNSPMLIGLVLLETAFLQNFAVDYSPTKGFLPALHVTDYYACGL